MGLTLNDTVEPYKEAYGSGKTEIPKLVGEGRVLLSVERLAERRVNSAQNDWRDNYFFTGDAFVYSRDGKRFKAVRNSDHLAEVNGNTRLIDGAIPLEDGVYDALEGEEFVVAEVKKYIGQDLSPQEQKGNPIWAAFIPDKALRDEYTDRMSGQMKQRFGYDKVMGVYVPDNTNGKSAILRPAVVDWLGYYWSRLDGGNRIDNYDARWVGVAPEALSAPGATIQRPNLETSLRVVNEHLRKAGFEFGRKE